MIVQATNRLILRYANPADAHFFVELMNSEGWLAHIGDRGIKTQADAVTYIENSLLKSYAENGFGLYLMETLDARNPIGICGLVKRETLPLPDLGFAILPQYEGNGFIYEASAAVLEFAQHTLKLFEILAITTPSNKRSQDLLDRLGFALVENKKTEKETLLRFRVNLLG